jgi:hypothetical protein
MRIIDLHVIRPSPHPGALAHLSTFEMLRAMECTLIISSIVFIFGLVFESFKECEGVSNIPFAPSG